MPPGHLECGFAGRPAALEQAPRWGKPGRRANGRVGAPIAAVSRGRATSPAGMSTLAADRKIRLFEARTWLPYRSALHAAIGHKRRPPLTEVSARGSIVGAVVEPSFRDASVLGVRRFSSVATSGVCWRRQHAERCLFRLQDHAECCTRKERAPRREILPHDSGAREIVNDLPQSSGYLLRHHVSPELSRRM